MTGVDVAVVAGAGIIAGAVNTVAGGGSLLTFPVLIGVGLTPLAANVTNTIGLVPGQFSGSHGYRRELHGQRWRMIQLGVPMAIGGGLGAALLLTTPTAVFSRVVPWLIVVSCLALFFQPRLTQLVGRHGHERSWPLRAILVLSGAYGGYFGAAIGIMLLGLLTLFLDDTIQRLNAVKVVLTGLVNGLAAVAFAIFGPVHWTFALVLAVASLVGGSLGAIVGRRIPEQPLRVGVAVVGLGVAVKLLIAG